MENIQTEIRDFFSCLFYYLHFDCTIFLLHDFFTFQLDKASKLLGIDELQITNPPDSGRFSMNSPDKLEPLLKVEDRGKFKSLGDLHMEKGLPVVLVNQ